MADFCHEWEPGGIGCHGHGYPEINGNIQCPPDCLGDFTQAARELAKKIGDGEEILLGLCEGHGTRVLMYRVGRKLYIEHATNGSKEWSAEPGPVVAREEVAGKDDEEGMRTKYEFNNYEFGPNATGTYARVIQFHQGFNGDGNIVLYLLGSGLYLFIGHWKGFELTVAAGTWRESNHRVLLDGVGAHLVMDVVPFSKSPRRHAREFRVTIEDYSRALIAETEHEGWSLLSWRGRLYYLGRDHFFDLHNDSLPRSHNDVEPWTLRFLDSCGFKNE